ncbi:MAG: iron-sulfur cluster-binding domain-containing protein [Spirochaetales bacterium]|nr:iron-sulfur cluster-binding domain-containing protein [Spirochaetales bacterium]
MVVTVKGKTRDLLRFIFHLRKRNRLFKKAPAAKVSPGPMNILAQELHPLFLELKVTQVRQETPLSKTFRLAATEEGKKLPCFRAGQYLVVEDRVEGTPVSRPFSLSSTPDEAADGGYYDITVKGDESGFFAPWALSTWKTGKILRCTGPAGNFYIEPLREADHLVCLAGGSGITPFRSIIKDSLSRNEAYRFTLLYGIPSEEEMIFRQELQELRRLNPDRFTFVPVCSGEQAPEGMEKGFITADLIRRYVSDIGGVSFFFCGPPAMGKHLEEELKVFHLAPRRSRREHYGNPPLESQGEAEYSVTVISGEDRKTMAAREDETVLIALERAGLNPPAMCRSGECGWCRSRLLEGEIRVPDGVSGLRRGDEKFGWFHPCSSYPRSDLVMEVPENPLKNTGE